MTDSQTTIDELISNLRQMRLPIMADQLRDLYASEKASSLSALDVLEIMITEEFQSRRHNSINRHLKQAKLSQPTAHMNEIDFSPGRQINPAVISQLRTCLFVDNHRNVIIQGATGTGKSYIANALCRFVIEAGYTARYIRMIELLSDLYYADVEERLPRFFKQLSKVDVLVIDDFLLTSTTEQEQKYLMEIFEMGSRNQSLILASQMSAAEWHKKLGGGAVADAILDRAVSNAYKIIISGDSLRPQSGSD